MAETLTIRTASSTEVVKIAVQGPQGPKGDKGDPGDVAGLPLTTQGDILYRGASENQRLAIGSAGQVLKVSNGLPAWANESGAVSSVNGQTGAVILDGSEIDTSGNDDFAAIKTGAFADGNGVYFPLQDVTLNGKRVYRATSGHYIFFENLRWHITDGSPVTANIIESSDDNNSAWPWLSAWSGDVDKATVADVVGRARGTFLFIGDSIPNTSVSGLASVAASGDYDDLSGKPAIPSASSATPSALGTAAAGSSSDYSRSDHIHSAEVSDAAFRVFGSADSTKKIAIEVDLLTTATTRTLTVPDKNITLDDQDDPRDPTAHAASHAAAGSDPVFDQDLNTTDEPTFAKLAINADGDALTMTSPNSGQVSMRWVSPPDSGSGNFWEFGCDTLNTNDNNFFIWDFTNNRPALWANGETGNVVWGGEYAEGTLPAKVQVIGISPSTATLLGLDNKTAGAVAMQIRAAASQSANLSEWLDSNDNVVASIDADGNISAANLGTAATADSTDFAAASHTHTAADLDSQTASNGHVLTADGSGGSSFQALPASGVSAVGSSVSDILSVSGSDLVADDLGADKLYGWDDSAGKAIGFTIGSGLTVTDDTLSATASGGSKTYAVFTATDNQPPSTAFATLDTRNSIAVLDFDDATDESAVFVGIIPEGASLGSGLKIRLHWMATSATSGNCVWDVSLERMTTDLDSDSFDTIASATAAANGTSGILTVTEITLTTIDSVTAGDGFRLKVTRDANNGSDTMSGDAELVAVEVRSAA